MPKAKAKKKKTKKRKTMKMGSRAEVKDTDFPDPLKFKKGYQDIIRVISDEFHVYDMHRKRLSASSYVYANCKGKGCPLCKAGDDPQERYALEVLHISRQKIGKKKSIEVINEVIPWAFAGRMQNELTDLYDEEGELTGYNIKLKCREADQEQFQKPTINKTKGKLDAEQKSIIKEKRGKIIDSFVQPSKDEWLKKMVAKLTGEDEDEDDEDMEDEDIDDFDEDEDDEDFEDEDFDEAIADMEDEDDEDDEDEEDEDDD